MHWKHAEGMSLRYGVYVMVFTLWCLRYGVVGFVEFVEFVELRANVAHYII